MKKTLILLSAVMAVVSLAKAQNVHYGESYELSDTLVPNQSHEYTASNYIELQGGFYSSPNTGKQTLLELDSEGYGIHPPEDGLTNGSGCVVGSLGGTLDVGAMGGLLYSIPLELPEGINGMRPSLSITYNSQGGNGLLGWGWDLSGLSSITRTGKTIYHDGEMTAADLSWDDCFLLDGKRLVVVADYTDSIEYRMEQDEMSKIMAYKERIEGFPVFFGLKRLARFKVWKSDGVIMEYGSTKDSWIDAQTSIIHALSWQLSKVSDRNGNSVLYHYNESVQTGEFLIDTIKYTVNTGLNIPAQFVVSFQYQGNRQDMEKYYIGGSQITLRHLLKSVTVTSTAFNKPLCKYEFQYEWDNKRLYNILLKVNMKSYDEDGASETIKATSFEWGSSTYCQQLQHATINSGVFEQFPFTGDFNGDGYTDVALVPYKDSTVYNTPVSIKIYLNNRNQGFEYVSSMDILVPASLDWVHVLDINGDGLDDLVPYFYDTVPASGTETTKVKVYLNNSSIQSFSYLGQKEIQGKGDVITGDFDGDGTMDAILLEKFYDEVTYRKDGKWTDQMPFIKNVFYLGFQEGQFHTIKLNTDPLNGLGPVYNAITGDYNGDGTTEVLLLSINESGSDYHGSKICRFDFNDSSDCLKIVQSFPGYYDYPYQSTSSSSGWCHVFPGDFNGDGKADILYRNLGSWNMCLSEGDSLGTPHTVTNPQLPHLNQYINLYYPSLRIVKQAMTYQYMVSFAVADFDGDGCSDVGCTLQSNTNTLYFFSKITTESPTFHFRKYFYSEDGVQFHSQFIHVGNFFGRDNPSFLCSLQPDKGEKSGTATIHTLYSVGRYNTITAITDGLGNRISFTYDYLTPKVAGTNNPFYSYNYTAPNTHGVRPVPLPVMALKTSSVEGVNSSKVITKYRYHNAMYHKYGHGFMGFAMTIAETYHNSTDSLWTTRKVRWNESSTMEKYAMLLPQQDFSYVNNGDEIIATNKTRYTFTNVQLAGLSKLVVCPAMTRKTEEIYSVDEDDELIATVTTSYQYNYNSNHTYDNVYGCTNMTETVTGHGNRNTTTELQTVKLTELQTIPSSWIVNRPLNETVTRTRNNESTATKTCYTYASNNSYRLDTVRVIPNDGSQPNDPLTLFTLYDYDALGHIIGITTTAPYGIHGEQPRKTGYEYNSDYQHRLVSREIKGDINDGYITTYAYDFHDRPSSVTDCNGKRTVSVSSILGTDQSVSLPDGTEQRSLTMWTGYSPYKPENACYYTWSKKTGGVTSMTFYHNSGAELRNVTFDLQGHVIFVDKRYNVKGLLERESVPYRRGESAENIQWTVYHYDALDRVNRIDYPDGSMKTVVYDGLVTTTTITPQSGSNTPPQTSVKKTNALGWLRESVDTGGTSVFYEYYADGNLKWSRIGNDEATKIRMEYDHAGNRTLLHDPDYCTSIKDLVSVYNAFGEEVSRTTPKDIATTFTYDKFGRMTRRVEDNKTTIWHYWETVPNKGLLQAVAYPTQNIVYTYDTCHRVKRETVYFTGGGTYVTKYDYDRASRISTVTYPSGVKVRHRYNSIGYLCAQADTLDNELYRINSVTPMGQPERFTLGGVLANTLEYDTEKHLLTKIKTQKNNTNVQIFTYTYDGFCNLATRKDNMKNLTETFSYDSENRLTGVWLGTAQTGATAYDSYGRMTGKTAGGQTVFTNAVYNATAKPHAMDYATTETGVFPTASQNVTYTGFDKVSKVKQNNDSLCYTYGYDHQRIFMEEHVGNTIRAKRYVGNCEYVTETTGNTTTSRWLTYLSGPTGVYAVVETENGTNTLHYILKDNLGSWTTITDDNGTIEQKLSYDAWGNLRNPNTWNGGFNGMPMFDRGFTGHEHLYNFGLINMNGRMYDPVMSSFLSVDQYVQSPENAQSFNRYAYCMNNPLRYIDPSGWLQVGGGTSGYTPNSSANANDPYAYYQRVYEWRDICGVGVRTEVAVALLEAFMYGNNIGIGGTVSFGDDGRISDIDLFLSFRYDFNQLNQTVPPGTIGKCVLMGLGSTKKYWQNTNGGKWGDGTKQWLNKSQKYTEQTGKDFSDPKNLIEFIQWNDAENTFKSYEAAFIPLLEVPDAILDGFVVAACSELKNELDIQLNLGEKGHFANVSRIKTHNGSIELDFIEPEGTNIMETFYSSSLIFHGTPRNLKNISFIKYKLQP